MSLTGDYYIVNPASNQVIGPIGVGDIRLIGGIGTAGSVTPPVFRLEYTDVHSPWGTVFYRLYLKDSDQRTYADGEKVVVSGVDGPLPTSWLIYHKKGDTYGIVENGPEGELRAWNLPIDLDNIEVPLILQSFPTTHTLPPGFVLNEGHEFGLVPVGPN